MPSNHLILCCPLLLLPSIFSSIKFFSNESAHRIWWPKYWNFSFIIILPMNIQGLFPLELTGLISLLSRWLSSVFSSTTIQKHHFFGVLPSLLSNSHIHTWLLENPQLWLTRSLLFNTLSKFVIAFFPRSKHLLISWLKSLSAVILEPKKIKSATVSTVCSSICYEVMV